LVLQPRASAAVSWRCNRRAALRRRAASLAEPASGGSSRPPGRPRGKCQPFPPMSAAQSGQELVPRHQSGADEHRCPRHQPAIGEFHAGEPVIVHHEPGHLGVNDPDPTDGQPLTLVCGQGDPVWVRPHRTRPPPRRTPSRSPPPPSLRSRTVADNSGCRFRAIGRGRRSLPRRCVRSANTPGQCVWVGTRRVAAKNICPHPQSAL
jgi:hypothetical protein